MFVECVNICLSESLSVADSVQQVMLFYIQSNKSYLTHWTEHNEKTLVSSCCRHHQQLAGRTCTGTCTCSAGACLLPDAERADL